MGDAMIASSDLAELRVAAQYGTENLAERILAAFAASGKARDSLTVDDLSAAD
jgi:hypothetical protein